MVEHKMDQVKVRNIIAEHLPTVCSQDEVVKDDIGTPRLRADGTLKCSRTLKAEVPMPPDPETLRRRMKMIGAAWAMIRL